jgi:hypothetical protein
LVDCGENGEIWNFVCGICLGLKLVVGVVDDEMFDFREPEQAIFIREGKEQCLKRRSQRDLMILRSFGHIEMDQRDHDTARQH